MAAETPRCETCDDDGYVDIVDDWGGVIGPAPCPNCSVDDPLEAVERVRARQPRPDFDPRIDYPERYTEGPV